MILQPEQLMAIFFTMMPVMMIAGIALYVMANWYEIKATRKTNCLIWRHPDNTVDSLSRLEFIMWDEAPGGYWPYKSFFFLSEKLIKWCYEVLEVDKDNKPILKDGEKTFKIEPFLPDAHINYTGITCGELADALDWRPAKRLLQQKAPMLQKMAQGGVIIMGLAALFGIMALLDMLGKGG